MRTVIVSVQRKGGVGKTTVAVSVAGELRQRGHRVAVVDADSQRSAAMWGELRQLQFPIHELPLEAGRASDWVRRLEGLAYDFVVVDTPPNEYAVGAAVAVATIALVPCTPSGLDLDATGKALNVVNAVRARRRDPLPVLLVPNRVDGRSLEGRQLSEELRALGETVAPSLGDRRAFVRAFSTGQTVNTFAPGSVADREVKALSDAVLRTTMEPTAAMRSSPAALWRA